MAGPVKKLTAMLTDPNAPIDLTCRSNPVERVCHDDEIHPRPPKAAVRGGDGSSFFDPPVSIHKRVDSDGITEVIIVTFVAVKVSLSMHSMAALEAKM